MAWTAVALGMLALLLAWPVPVLFARASWPSGAPARALLLWQLIALAGGASIIGALVLAGIAGLEWHPLAAGIAFGAAIGFVVHLLGHLAATALSVERQRRHHHALLQLLSSPHPTESRTLVLDDGAPVAYCLPHGIGSLTVLSRGLIETLGPAELAAVVAHERAHVEQRHDILLVAFRAWRSALPWFPIAALAAEEVGVLVELLADDHARRSADDACLARAILAVAGRGPDDTVAGVPAIAPRSMPRRTTDRVRRLLPADAA